MKFSRTRSYPGAVIWRVLLGALCILVLLAGDSSSQDVNSSHFGVFDFTELEETAYDLEISSIPVFERELTSDSWQSHHVILVSRHGQKYSCDLPDVLVREEDGSSEPTMPPNISALLGPMRSRPCLLKTVGWWTYEYCHNQFIRQYHLEAGRIVGKTVWLGFFENETIWDEEYTDKVKGVVNSLKRNTDGVALAFHSSLYVNGTECDITGKPRRTVARLYCSHAGMEKLIDVEERETCNYTLTIQSSLLCSHPLFESDSKENRHMLTCFPVVTQEEYEKHLWKEAIMAQEQAKQRLRETSLREEEDINGNPLFQDFLMKVFSRILKASGKLDSGELFESGTEFVDKYNTEEQVDSNVQTKGKLSAETVGETNEGKQGKSGVDGSADHSETKSVSTDSQDERGESHGETEDDAALDRALDKLLESLREGGFFKPQETSKEKKSPPHAIPRSVSDSFRTGEETSSSKEEERGQYSAKQRTDTERARTKEFSQESYRRSELSTGESKKNIGAEPEKKGKDESKMNPEDDLDEEALKEIEKATKDAIEEQLNKAGLDEEVPDVKVKVFTMSTKEMLEKIGAEELAEDLPAAESDGGLFEESDSTTKEVKVKIITSDDFGDSLSKLIDELLFQDEEMTEDRQKQQDLESNYEQVYGDKEKKQPNKLR